MFNIVIYFDYLYCYFLFFYNKKENFHNEVYKSLTMVKRRHEMIYQFTRNELLKTKIFAVSYIAHNNNAYNNILL